MNPGGGGGPPRGRPQDYHRGMSDYTADSDNNITDITNGRNIDIMGGDSDSDSSWQGENSDRQTISQSEFPPSTRFDRCISVCVCVCVCVCMCV